MRGATLGARTGRSRFERRGVRVGEGGEGDWVGELVRTSRLEIGRAHV